MTPAPVANANPADLAARDDSTHCSYVGLLPA